MGAWRLAVPVWVLPELLRLLPLLWLVPGLIFWLWMLKDCADDQRITSQQRTVWLLAIFFTNMLGAAVYFAYARGRRGARGN